MVALTTDLENLGRMRGSTYGERFASASYSEVEASNDEQRTALVCASKPELEASNDINASQPRAILQRSLLVSVSSVSKDEGDAELVKLPIGRNLYGTSELERSWFSDLSRISYINKVQPAITFQVSSGAVQRCIKVVTRAFAINS